MRPSSGCRVWRPLHRLHPLHRYNGVTDEAAVEWLSGVAIKLATYTATGFIILLHVGGDMVNGLRLLILSARLMAISHFEARRRVRDVRLAVVMSDPDAEVEAKGVELA